MITYDTIRQSIVERLPLLYVFLSGLGFSLQALTVKTLAEQGFAASYELVFTRGCIQSLLSAVIIYRDNNRLAGNGPLLFGDTNRVRYFLFMRSLVGYFGIAFAFMSVEYIPMGDAVTLAMLSPLIAAIAAFFILGEPWRLPELFATIVSLAGATLVAKPPFLFGTDHTEDTGRFCLGVTYALICAFSAGFAYIFVRILGTIAKMPWANVCFAQAIGQIILSLPSAYIFGQQLSLNFTFTQLVMILGGGFVGAVSQILMTIGMQREKSATATAMRMSDVVFGFIWQSLFTHDVVSTLSVVGAMLVSSSILIIVVFKPKVDSSPGDFSKPSNEDKAELDAVEMATHATFTIVDDDDGDTETPSESSSDSTVLNGLAMLKDSLLLPLSRTGDTLLQIMGTQWNPSDGNAQSASSVTTVGNYATLPQAEK